jgi:hypothetical protein
VVVHGSRRSFCLGEVCAGLEAFIEDYGWLPRDKLWVNFLANNQAIAERLGFSVDPADHWRATQSGCLTPCVICDAPESDGESAGFEAADGRGQLQAESVGRSGEFPCLWCWTERAEEHWELRQVEETGTCNGRTRYRCSSANHVRNPWLSSSTHLTGLLVESASL